MEIYTINQRNQPQDPDQLNLIFNEQKWSTYFRHT